ncbi:PAS domain S-box protein [Natronoflexus pectinivorans]|uniref:histidine kinase n=1 Tax=Natronoflexus pectinivorans TaxID=682526 RepID=A0A4R2GIC6_9BACT|nr:PAS domain S-box protein [Natronoflexus pectinivorans]TCO08258.1 PAS domain S-box-containing protein [Natronoflexus pectinivorans]
MNFKEIVNRFLPDHTSARSGRSIETTNTVSAYKTAHSEMSGNSVPGHLPLTISNILSSSGSFDAKLQKVVNYLGLYTNVCRVYIFENSSDGETCSNRYEWCNEDVISQKENLQNVSFKSVPSWMKLLKEEGQIEAVNVARELPADISSLLTQQDIKSILVFPIQIGKKIIGFAGYDECKQHRHWSNLDKSLLATVSKLLSNAYQQEHSIRFIRESLHKQQFLFDIASLINQAKTLDEPFGKIAEKISTTWGLSGFALYSVSEQNSKQFRLNTAYSDTSQDISFPEQVLLPDSGSIITIPSLRDESPIKQEYSAITKELGFPTTLNTFIRGVRTFNGANGIIFLCWTEANKECPIEHSVLETLAGMLARQIDHIKTEEKILQNHQHIIRINEQLQEKESFLNNIILAAPVGVILVKDYLIKYVNQQVCESLGYSREELLEKSIAEFYTNNEEVEKLTRKFFREIEVKGISSIDLHLRKKDGSPLFYQITGTPGPETKNEDLFLLIGQDLTEIKTIENSLIESEQRNSRIIEANIDGIFIMSEPGKLVYVNKSACDQTGYNKEELTKLSLSELFPDKNGIRDYLKIINQLRQGFDYRGDSQIRHKNGSTLYVEIHGTSITLAGEPHFYFSIHDITKRKQNEAALRLSEKKFRSLSENIPDCVVRINKNGLILFGNTLFLDLYKLSEKITKESLFLSEALPEDFSDYFAPAVNYVFKQKKIVQLEIDLSRNGEKQTFDWSLSPEMDDHGNCISVLGIGRNITPRKKVEKELLLAKEKAEAADKLKSAFLANMSHEIRTPLNAIVGFSNLLEQTDPESSDRDEFIKLINDNADQLMSLITDIVDIAKLESGHLEIKREPVEVDQYLESIYRTYLKRISLQFKEKVNLKYSPPVQPKVKTAIIADPNRFIQTVNNLLDNAIKFTHQGTIEFGYNIEDKKVRFFIRDTGIGISKEHQHVVFDAFRQEDETNARKYGGTGLGLTLCRKLIESMNGQIGLISEKGKGSEFYFYLDRFKEENFKSKTKNDLQIEQFRNEPPYWEGKILLLVSFNSNTHIRAKNILNKTGITILSARSLAALYKLMDIREDIDIVLIDEEFELNKDIVKPHDDFSLLLLRHGNKHHTNLVPEKFDGSVMLNGNEAEFINRLKIFLNPVITP